MMGINFRILLPFLLFYDIEVSSAQTFQDVVTFTTKPVEELTCQFTSSSITVQWTEHQDGGGTIVLFSYVSASGKGNKEATDEKYNNFDYLIDQESNSFNLLITNVDKDDGGTYVCTPFSAPTVTFDLNVEVIPASISIYCTASNACTTSAESEVAAQIVCVCTATGLNSNMLKIEWEGVDAPTTNNSTSVTDPTSGTFNISSETTLPRQDAISSVSCSLTGYKSQIPEGLRSDSYTFSPPVCNLTHECSSEGKSAVLICSCFDGSPKISAYGFYNSQMLPIGLQFNSSRTLKVEAHGKDTFFCRGCNGVIHNEIAEKAFNCQQGLAWWIFLFIGILLALSVVIVVLLVKKCKKDVDPNGIKPDDGSEKDPLRGNAFHPEHRDVEAPKQKEGTPLISVRTPENDKGDKQCFAHYIPDYAVVNKQRGEIAAKREVSEKEKEDTQCFAQDIPVYADVNKQRGNKGPEKEIPNNDSPKKKGASEDPSKNLAPKTEAPRNKVSKKEEDRVKAGSNKEAQSNKAPSGRKEPSGDEAHKQENDTVKTGSNKEAQSNKALPGQKQASVDEAHKKEKETGKQDGADVDHGEKGKKQQNDTGEGKQDGADVNSGEIWEEMQNDDEKENKDTPPTKERTPGDGKAGAESFEPMNRERTVPYMQGIPAYSAALQKQLARCQFR